MRQITEQQILTLAPNPAAANNGRKISAGGKIVRRMRSEDDTFYLCECKGSGSSNYTTTADFINPANPVFRCSCPSRQFPCKHSLGLLFEILAEKEFTPCEIPEDIIEKRAKLQAKAEKVAQAATSGGKADAPAPKVNKAARIKKLKRQLEGLELTAKLIQDLVTAGLGTMGGTALNTYRELSKQLGDYYLPGPQRLLNCLIIEIAAFQKDGDDGHYEASVHTLEDLWALVKKSRVYLTEKLENGTVEQDDNVLYEELGGVWKLSELASLGLCKQNARLAQLAFWIVLDEASKSYIDTGCWADVESGEISMTYNYRPIKAVKYIKQDDTVFGVVNTPVAVFYPGNGNRRVRWEGAEILPLGQAELGVLFSHAAPHLAPAVKNAKNFLKNTLTDPAFYQLIHYKRIGQTPDGPALEDNAGGTILLADQPGMEASVLRLTMLPDADLLEDKVLLGGFWYDVTHRRLFLQPISILTENHVVRLLY